MNSEKYGKIARNLGIVCRDAHQEILEKHFGIKKPYYGKLPFSTRRLESLLSGGKKNPTYLEVAENLIKISEQYKFDQNTKDAINDVYRQIEESGISDLRAKINYLNNYKQTDEEKGAARDWFSGFVSEDHIAKSKKTTNLKTKREAAGLSQSQFSSRVGISIRSLQDYEQGHRNINGAAALTVCKMAEVLGCHPKEILEKE